MNQAQLHYDNMEDVRERLENSIATSNAVTLYDGEDCFIIVTQRNNTTGDRNRWDFCVDFGTNKVRMLEPTEDEESFSNDNEVFRIIKNFLDGGSSREKRMNRPDYDSGEPIKITRKGIGSSKKPIKSGYYDTREHPEGGGTCDNCHEEVMPGDGYESDFESSREMALEGIIDAFKLGNIDIYDYFAKQQLIDFLDMEDEDELEDAISEICNMAFEGKGYQCPTCAQMNLGIAAKAWVEDNYDLDNEIESSAIKSAKSEFGYDAHETMTFDEFKNFVKSVVEPVEMFDYKSAYFVILNNEEDCKKLQQKLDDTYGVGCTYYSLQDPNNEYHGKWQLMA